MLLRASGEASGTAVDLGVVVDDAPISAGIPNATELAALVDASVRHDDDALERARQAMADAMGRPALVDAAGVIGNFERVNRIADATGIPLDGVTRIFGATDGARLGFSRFANADGEKRPGRLAAAIADFVAPTAFRIMALAGGRFSARRRRNRGKRDAS